MAIMTPLRPRMGKTATLCVAVGIWTVSGIFSVPNLLVYKVFHHVEGDRHICYPEWTNSSHQKTYEILFLFITYVVPIGSMTFAYARIGIELWGSQSIGECTQRQMENIRNKRRVVKMMMIVVIIFAVCWLPYDLYFIITSFYPEVQNQPYIQETYLAIYWLAMSNSMYNPIIYCWLNARFRRGFKQVFSWLPYVNVSPAKLTRRGVFTSNRRSYSGSPDHNRIVRNGTVRTPLYNACANQSSADTCYTNVDDFGSVRGSRRWRTSVELRQPS
nr:tachykinin-like peptides receptor 99D [Onthophagus taurus]